MMKVNKWTLGLAAVGLVSLPAVMQADEKMNPVNTALSSTTLSGYVDTSAHWNLGTGTMPPRFAFNNASKSDGFNLNVVNLVLEKPLEATENWTAGYKVDMIYGPNAVGWNNSLNARNSDFALKQAYVQARIPLGRGIDIKMGTFDTIIGYETFNAGANPNYTRSWGYTIEPTEHTGLLATYQFCKEFGIAAGVANTWTAGINQRAWLSGGNSSARPETTKTYMGAVSLSAPDSWGWIGGSTLYAGVVSGFGGNIKGTRTDDSLLSFYAGLTMKTPAKGLKFGVCYDYDSNNLGLGNNIPTGRMYQHYAANAAAFYVTYAPENAKWSLHGRFEYVWSNLGRVSTSPANAFYNEGFSPNMISATATFQYNLWANVISRLEFRWDHSLDDISAFDAGSNSGRTLT